MIDDVTSDCRWLDTAQAGDTVEVWTSVIATLQGLFLGFEGIEVLDAR